MNNPQDSNEQQRNPYKAISAKLRPPGDTEYEGFLLGKDNRLYPDADGYANYLLGEIEDLELRKVQAKAALYDLLTNKTLEGVYQEHLAHTLYYTDDRMSEEDIAAALGCDVNSIHEKIGEYELDAGCANCGTYIRNVARTRDEVDGVDMVDGDLRFLTLLCDECEKAELLATRDPEELRKMPYADYLNTSHWKETRQGALKRAGYRCQLCNAKGSLHVHHRTYERRGSEQPGDLLVLCATCHKTFHDNHKVVKE